MSPLAYKALAILFAFGSVAAVVVAWVDAIDNQIDSSSGRRLPRATTRKHKKQRTDLRRALRGKR